MLALVTRILSAVLILATLAQAAEAWPHKHSQKVRVQFLAESTLLRNTWGPNEDTYLVDLSRNHSETILVRLVDAYPNEAPPLSHAVLTSDSGTTLYVTRDESCDRSFGNLIACCSGRS